jgi:hypothetical protein
MKAEESRNKCTKVQLLPPIECISAKNAGTVLVSSKAITTPFALKWCIRYSSPDATSALAYVLNDFGMAISGGKQFSVRLRWQYQEGNPEADTRARLLLLRT